MFHQKQQHEQGTHRKLPSVRRRRLIAGVVALASIAGIAVGTSDVAGARGGQGSGWHDWKWRNRADFTLTVLHNNDGESSLTPFDVDGVEYGGIGMFVTKVSHERARAMFGWQPGESFRRASVLLNSGDNFLAGTTFQASRVDGAPFYDALGIRLAGYDALAVGNHEFDFGPDVFNEFVEAVNPHRATIPFVSANLDYSADPNLSTKVGRELVSSTVLHQHGEKVGVVGLTTPTLPTISSPVTVEVRTDLAAIAQQQIDKLTRRGVDKIILVSHLQGLQSEIDLVSSLRDVDIVIGGGGDEVLGDDDTRYFPGDEDNVFGEYPQVATDSEGVNVPVVTTPGNYKYVGRLIVNFDRKGEVLSWGDDSGIQLVTDIRSNRRAEQLIEEPVSEFLAELEANVIATSEVDLQCERNDVRGGESNCGNLMADSLLAAAAEQAAGFGLPAPDVAVQNGGGIRGEIDQPAGPFTEADSFRLAPFANFVALATDVPGETFRQLLEEGAIQLPASGEGGFAQIAGASYVVDTSFPARVTDESGVELSPGSRVRSIVLDDGTVIVADGVATGETVNLASIDFSLAGGDGYPVIPFTRLGVSYQQALASFVADELGGVITASDYPIAGEGRIIVDP